MALTAVKVTESRDPDRPRSIDVGGSVLVALTLTPFVLAVSKGSDWGWTSVATLGCLALAVVSGFAFVAVEKRVAVPMLDLALLRNRILVGSTIAILIGAGTINALMYLVSLYFQDPETLGFSPLEAGLATLPATAGLVAVAPLVPRLAKRFGGITAFRRSPAEGVWREGQGDVSRDEVVIFEVMTEHLNRQWWSGYRKKLEKRFRQEELVIRATQVEFL